MLKILTLACVLLGLLCAVSIESWLRRHIGNKQFASDVYQTSLEKYSEFWIAILIPVLTIVIICGIIVGTGTGINAALAYAGGASVCFISTLLGNRSFVSGAVSGASYAAEGDIRAVMKSAYRSGAVMGVVVTTACTAALSLLVFIFKQDQLTDVATSFALGAVITGAAVRLTGSVLTSAHKLSAGDEFTADYTGSSAAIGADFSETFIIAVCVALLLSRIAVTTAGASAVFTSDAAARYPVILSAVGVAASVIGIFTFRAATGKNSHFGYTAGVIVAGVIMFASAILLSNYVLGDRSYSFCTGFGILAQIAAGEINKTFSSDSAVFRRNLPSIRDENNEIHNIQSISVGLVGAAIPGVLSAAAILLSFNIAQYYGVALAAIGANSLFAINIAIREYSDSLLTCADFTEASDENSEENSGYYKVLRRISSEASVIGRSYSSVAFLITLIALILTLNVRTEKEYIALSDPTVIGGLLAGTITAVMILGILTGSFLRSSISMLDSPASDRSEYRNISSVHGSALIEILSFAIPGILGIAFGADFITGFVTGAAVTSAVCIFVFNNTGRNYDKIIPDALGSSVKLMAVTALALIPAFIKFGGFNF